MKTEQQKNVLVTGGSGFIGSHTVDELINLGFNVVVVDRKSPSYRNNKAVYYQLDLNVSGLLSTIFKRHKFDYVIHLAAQISVAVSVGNPIQDALDNIIASLNVINLCKKHNVHKLIVSSSAALYASPQYLPIDEKHSINFLSPYAVSKHTMEEYVKLSGLDYIIFRYANVYGPRQNSNGESGVISIFIDKMMNNLPIQIYGDGEQTRDFIFVKDVAKANCLALLTDIKNVTINVSTNTQITVNELFSLIGRYLGYNLTPEYLNKRPGDILNSTLDNSLLKSYLMFTPETNIQDGLKETISFKEEEKD